MEDAPMHEESALRAVTAALYKTEFDKGRAEAAAELQPQIDALKDRLIDTQSKFINYVTRGWGDR